MAILDSQTIVIVLRSCYLILMFVLVADNAVEDVEVSRSAHYTTFAACVCISADGGHSVEIEELILIERRIGNGNGCEFCGNLFFGTTDDDIGLAKYIVGQVSMTVGCIVLANGTFPSAAIDVTD